jgi:hypothetical protein
MEQEQSNTFGNIQKSLTDTYNSAAESASNTYNSAAESASSMYNNAAESTAGPISSINESITGVQDSFKNTMNEFSNKSVGQASAEFLESNSIIARFAFILIVVIIFMILLRLGIWLIGYFSQPSESPYLVSGMISGTDSQQIKQDPKDSNSITLLRSNNQPGGIEYTWSVWLNITDINNSTDVTTGTVYQHIFNKGNNTYGTNGIATVNNAPGLYLSNSTNPTLRVIMNTVVDEPGGAQFIDIDNVPLKRWFNVMIRLTNKNLDVYMNGIITGRLTFNVVPKQNYQDVFVCQNSGFSGNLSDLRYYSRSLNIFDINSIVMYGPNLNTSSKSSSANSNSGGYTYLSSSWYTNKM